VSRFLKEFVGRALNNATCHGQLRSHASEEGIYVSCTHAAFVDTPNID
jgi:diphthamide biosynthesis methyltransferase